MSKEEFEEKLIIGAKIKIGKEYSIHCNEQLKNGEIIELINGYFDCENGLYCYLEDCPAIWNGYDFDSIYHLFRNDFEYFLDCEII